MRHVIFPLTELNCKIFEYTLKNMDYIICLALLLILLITAHANSVDVQCRTHARIMNVKCLIFITQYK